MNGNKKLLVVGHGRHGKDTVAEYISKYTGLTFMSSSKAAAHIFIFDMLREQYGYSTFEECYNDRFNHRKEWHDLICDFNREDKSSLARHILKISDIYVGMRDNEEIKECLRIGLFDIVIGVFDPRKPLEPSDSFDIDLFAVSDFVICSKDSLDKLEENVKLICKCLV